MNKTFKQLANKYASCPTKQKELVIEGKKYIITRHFTGDKKINQMVYDIAVSRADREAGLL